MVAGFFRNRRLFVYAFGVKLHLRDGRTDGRRDATRLFVRPSVRSFVCLFVRCVCHEGPSYGETNRNASIKKINLRNLSEGNKSWIN